MDLRGSGTAVPLSGTPAPACNIHLRVTPHKGKRVFREMSYQNLLSQTISIGLAPLGKPELAATFLPSLRVKSWAGLVLISIDEAAKAAQQITSRTKVWLMNCSDAVVSIDREQALPGDSIQLRRGDKVHIHAWTFLVDWDFVYGDSSDVQAGLPAAVAHTSPVGQQNPALVLRNQQLQQQQQQHQQQQQQHQHQQAQQQQYHVQQPLSQPLPQQLVQQAHQQPPGVFQQTQHGQQHLHLQQAADPYGQQQMHRGYPGQQNPFPQTVVPTQPSQELMAHMAQQRQLIEEQSRRYEEQRKQLEELVAKQQQTIEKLNTVATGPVVPAPSPDTTSVSADDLVMDDQEREEAKPKKTQKKGGRPKKLKGQRGRRSSEEDLSSLEEPPSEPDNEPEEVEEKQEPPKRTRRASRSAKASSTIKTRRKSKGKKRSSPREGAATPTSSRSGRTISPPGTSTVDLVDRQKQAYREVRRLAKIAEGETVSQSFSLVPSRRAGTKRKRSDVEVDSVEEQRKILDETRSASARAYRESLKTGLQLRRKRRKVADNDTPALAEKKPKAEDEDSKEEPLVEEESRRASEESEGKEEEGSKSGEGDLDPSNLPLSPNPLPSPSLPPVSPITSPMPPGEGSASLSHQDDSGDIEMASPPSHVSSNSGTASTAFGLEQASAAAGLKPAADIDMPNAAALEAESLSNCTDTVDLTSSPEQAGTSLPSPDLQEQAHREMVLTAPLTPLAHSYTRVPLGPVQPSQPEPRPQAAGCETAPAASPWPAPQAGAFSEANAANCMDELCGELDRTSDVSMSSTLGVYTDGTPA